MGSVHFSPGELYGTLSEIVGCKSGLALSREDIDRFLKASDEVDEFTDYLSGSDDSYLRIESIVFEAMVATLLYQVGVLESPSVVPSYIRLYHAYKDDRATRELYEALAAKWTDFVNTTLETGNNIKNELASLAILVGSRKTTNSTMINTVTTTPL